MFTLTAQNKYGQRLKLTDNEAYVITDIVGLDPPDGVINTTRNANADGSVYNSAYVNDRTVIITLAINEEAEENRINLYKYFKPKYPVRLFYQNSRRNVYIDGYVKSFTVGFFAQKQVAQITIFCPNPFFNGSKNTITDFSSIVRSFEFPFCVEEDDPIIFGEIVAETEKNVINGGDVETGAKFVLHARGALSTPSLYRVDTGEYFTLNISMRTGDEIHINTIKKQKSVVLISQGVTTNIIGSLKSGSTWFQLSPADNIFTTDAATNPENLDVYCVVTDQFEGV